MGEDRVILYTRFIRLTHIVLEVVGRHVEPPRGEDEFTLVLQPHRKFMGNCWERQPCLLEELPSFFNVGRIRQTCDYADNFDGYPACWPGKSRDCSIKLHDAPVQTSKPNPGCPGPRTPGCRVAGSPGKTSMLFLVR